MWSLLLTAREVEEEEEYQGDHCLFMISIYLIKPRVRAGEWKVDPYEEEGLENLEAAGIIKLAKPQDFVITEEMVKFHVQGVPKKNTPKI